MTWQDKLKALNELTPTDVVMRFPKTWTASMKNTELKDGPTLASVHCEGSSMESVVHSLWNRVVDELKRDQRLVLHAYSPDRREVFWNGEKWVEWGKGT